MSADSFAQDLLKFYRGEMAGEESFTPLLKQYTEPYQQYFLGTALQLETETKARLRPVLLSLGLPIYEHEPARVDGRAIAGDIEDLDWHQMVSQMIEPLQHFVDLFQAIHDATPEDWKQITQSMVVHEKALLKAFKLEASGQSEEALKDIIAQLKYPLAPPQ